MLYALISSLVCFLCAGLGASIVFFIKKSSNKINCFLNAFSAGVMVASGIFSLIIPSIEYADQFNINTTLLLPACFIFVGLVFLLLIKFSKVDQQKTNVPLIMLGVGLHNIPEGICIGVAFASAVTLGTKGSLMSAIFISIGIGAQNIPEGTSIAFPLYCKGMSKTKAFFCSIGVAFVEVISCFLFYIIGSNDLTILPIMLAFAGAVMLIVAICDLMPEAISQHKAIAMFSLLVGFVLMMTLGLALE